MYFTPEDLKSLHPNDIFVFGTNQFGQHSGGAARLAETMFGAKHGIPIGLVDQTYGIITTSYTDARIDLEFIQHQIIVLYYFAETRPDLRFLVTKIGTGIAGWPIEQIAKLFFDNEEARPKNIILPKEFHNSINAQPK